MSLSWHRCVWSEACCKNGSLNSRVPWVQKVLQTRMDSPWMHNLLIDMMTLIHIWIWSLSYSNLNIYCRSSATCRNTLKYQSCMFMSIKPHLYNLASCWFTYHVVKIKYLELRTFLQLHFIVHVMWAKKYFKLWLHSALKTNQFFFGTWSRFSNFTKICK